MQDTVNERIKQLVKIKTFGNAKLFASEVGLPGPTVASIVSGQSKSVTDKTLRKIADKYSDINLHWLITGDGEVMRSNTQQIGSISGNQNTASNQFGGKGENYFELKNEIFELREKNMQLREENWELKKRVEELEKKSEYSNSLLEIT